MHLKYTVTRSALLQCSRLQTDWLGFVVWLGIGMFVVFAILELPYSHPPHDLPSVEQWLGVPLMMGLGFGLLFPAAMWLFILPLRVWTIYRQNPQFYGASEIDADEEGVEIRLPRATMKLPWADLRGFKENRHVFGICLSKTAGYAVPKIDMSIEQAQAFRNVLNTHLKRLN